MRIILEQQVSLASAAALFAKFERYCDGTVTAARVAESGEAGLLAIGFTRQKARYVVGLARQIECGTVALDRIARLPDDAARDALVLIPGVGPWTAGVYLLMALRRPDVWPPGDLGLHKSMAEVRGLRSVPQSEQAAAYARRWSPWRAVAARLLWHAYLSRRAKSWAAQPRATSRSAMPIEAGGKERGQRSFSGALPNRAGFAQAEPAASVDAVVVTAAVDCIHDQ